MEERPEYGRFLILVYTRLVLKRDLIEGVSVSKVLKLLIVRFILLVLGWQVWVFSEAI